MKRYQGYSSRISSNTGAERNAVSQRHIRG